MYKSVYIQKFLSGILLVVFALSITPKQFLHDVFAGHNDSKLEQKSGKSYQLSVAKYNCDNDRLVAESNFIYYHYSLQYPLITSFAGYGLKDISFCSIPVVYSLLRGPPVKI